MRTFGTSPKYLASRTEPSFSDVAEADCLLAGQFINRDLLDGHCFLRCFLTCGHLKKKQPSLWLKTLTFLGLVHQRMLWDPSDPSCKNRN